MRSLEVELLDIRNTQEMIIRFLMELDRNNDLMFGHLMHLIHDYRERMDFQRSVNDF